MFNNYLNVTLIINLSVVIFLFNSNNILGRQVEQDKSIFSLVETTSIELNNDYYLVNPRIVTGDANYVIWVEHSSIKFFGHDGKLIKTIQEIGNGPGEFRNITYAHVANDNLYIYVSSQNKVLVYSLEDLNLVDEVSINVKSSRMFTVSESGDFYFQHTHIPNSNTPSFSKFDSSGNKINEFGLIPIFGALNWNLLGGGITVDSNSNVYYTYTGEPLIYKYSSINENITKIENSPSYFDSADESEIRKIIGDTEKLIRYAFTVTRPASMHYHKDLIFLVLQDNHPWYGKPTDYYLEIWDMDGKKVENEFGINSSFIFFDGIYMYSLALSQSNYLQDSGTFEFIHKFKIGD